MNDPLDLPVTRERLDVLRAESLVSDAAFEDALALTTAPPAVAVWQRFIDLALLAAGSVLVTAGILFFVAYDWAALHRLQKLGLVAATLCATTIFAIVRIDRGSGRAALSVSTFLVGALLAVFGQVYQTGADTWQLFATWAVLALPFVLLSRVSLLFVLELLLVDLSLMLFVSVDERFGGGKELALVLSLLNCAAWVAAELAARRGLRGLEARTLSHVLACCAFVPLVSGVVVFCLGRSFSAPLLAVTLLFAVMVFGGVFAHARLRRDLFSLTVIAASLLAVFAAALGRFLFDVLDLDEGGLLLEGAALVGAVGVAILVLRTEAARPSEVSG